MSQTTELNKNVESPLSFFCWGSGSFMALLHSWTGGHKVLVKKKQGQERGIDVDDGMTCTL